MRLDELSPDLLATIAARLSFAELVCLRGMCIKMKQTVTADMLESKRHDYLLPQRVAGALVDAMDARFQHLLSPSKVLRLVRVDNVVTWHHAPCLGDVARVEYSLRDGTVNCLFPAMIRPRYAVDKELWATVASESSGLITRYYDGSVRPEDLPEFRMEHGHDPPAEPIAYSEGLVAFIVAEGLVE